MLTITSPAKLNLVLDIIRKQEDGYHEVEFFMQELELADTITIEDQVAGISLSCTPEGAMPLDSKNLIWKAVELLQTEFGITNGVHIHVDKKIPSAGGLGGGSSNAANVLKALNQKWGLHLSTTELVERASKLGMDCAFPIIGNSCIATGRGERLNTTPSPPPLAVLIVLPNIVVPEAKTKWIYSQFDVNRVHHHPSVSEFVQNIANQKDAKTIALACANAFEQGLIIPEYEPVWKLRDELQTKPGVLTVFLAGAGPTLVVIGENKEVLEKVADQLKNQKEIKLVCVTRTKAPTIF